MMGQRDGIQRWGACMIAALTLSGCMSPDAGGDGTTGETSRFMGGLSGLGAPGDADEAARAEAAASPVISALQARRSVIPPGSPYAKIVDPVLAANSRPAEAELRSARLRARAASKNWLPKIGPNISLTSLSDVIAQLVVEQVLFDNGRKKAERAFAKADVEVAAVTLVEDTNDRIRTALSLYLTAMKARERRVLEERTLKDMEHFEWVMSERVSDGSDLNVLRQKLAEIRATLAAQSEAEATALAELNAMSTRPLDDITGLSDLSRASGDIRPIEVLRAEAEKSRDIASAQVERGGLLPGLTAGGTLGDNGSGIGLNVSSDQLLGLGTGDSLNAIKATQEAAAARVGQAEEDAQRRTARLQNRLSALTRQVDEATALASRAKANLDLFQSQFKAGQRQVMDVVGVYETFAARQAATLDLKYERLETQLQIAEHLGVLAEGNRL